MKCLVIKMQFEVESFFVENSFFASPMMQFVLILLFVLVLVLWYLIRVKKIVDLERRIAPYIVDKNQKPDNLWQELKQLYLYCIFKIDRVLIYFKIVNSDYHHRYFKTINQLYEREISYLSEKIFIFIVLTLLSFLPVISFALMMFLFILIVILLETQNSFRYHSYLKKINEDFEQVITIMTNAFQAGKSVLQAIELVTKREENLLSAEFKFIHDEIKLGLSVDEAFKRFAQRTSLKEADYLASIMTILTKSGGDINHLFAAMQKRFYHKQEISLEIEAVTSGLKISAFILALMPIIMITFLTIINPFYFEPLIMTTIGRLIILIMLNLYMFYLIIIKKIFTVEVM